MSDLRVIILDFDGVLVESVGIKDRAFEKLFGNYPNHLERIMQYHRTHNAVIRFEKFRYIYEKILKENFTPDIERRLGEEFSEIVVGQVIHAPLVAGTEEFLNYFFNRLPLYIVSVNPPDELGKIIQAKKLSRYFKNVYAGGGPKTDSLKSIFKKENIKANQAIFIGDSPEDGQAAKAVGTNFIARFSGKSSAYAEDHGLARGGRRKWKDMLATADVRPYLEKADEPGEAQREPSSLNTYCVQLRRSNESAEAKRESILAKGEAIWAKTGHNRNHGFSRGAPFEGIKFPVCRDLFEVKDFLKDYIHG